MPVTEFSYSAFLRGPSEVLPALERGEVLLDRRDGESLVLTRKRRFSAGLQGVEVAARAMRSLMKDNADLAASLLEEQLPWIEWLPRGERLDCISEILGNLAAGAETGTFEPFARSVTEWEHTAEVWATPDLAERLTSEFSGDGGYIERPKERR